MLREMFPAGGLVSINLQLWGGCAGLLFADMGKAGVADAVSLAKAADLAAGHTLYSIRNLYLTGVLYSGYRPGGLAAPPPRG